MSTQENPANPAPATDPAPTPTQPVVPQPIQPPPTPPAPTPQPSHSPGNSPGEQLLAAINALPERIVHSLREQQAPPRKTAEPKATPEPKAEAAPTGTTPKEPGAPPSNMSRLAHWWFNG